MRRSVRILNVDIDDIVEHELLEELVSGIVMTVNVDFIMKMQRDREFWQLHNAADYVVADGQLVVAASRLLGTPLRARVAGADLFPAFYTYHRSDPDIRIFVLGAAPGVANEVMKRVNRIVGREMIVGAISPSYGFESNEAECRTIVGAINRSGATVLAIGVGAPKQEKWIARWRGQLHQVRIFLPIGATLDFEAGRLPRAPELFQKIGLEWFFRLIVEPRRLWRRYLIDDPPFFWLLLLQRIGRYRDPFANHGRV
jgi:exopolysaccharide biosynthesis WecB/TagA/CpsF family protein